MAKKRHLITLYLFSFFTSFNGFALIQVLYFHEILKSLSLAMSIIGLIPIFMFLLEIPTGVLSDKIGRKNSIIAGTIFHIISMIFYILGYHTNLYIVLVTGTFFRGLGYSLFSGTNEALFFETAKELDNKASFSDIWGRNKSIIKFSEAVSTILAGIIAYKYSYLHVIYFTMFSFLLSFIVSFFIKDYKFSREKEIKKDFIKTFSKALKLFKENKKLRKIAIGGALCSSLHDTTHRLEIVYFETLIPLQLIGFARALKKFFSSIGFWFGSKFLMKFGNKKSLFISEYFAATIKSAGLLFNNIFTPFIIAFENFGFSASELNYSSLQQKEFSDDQRATMGSITSFFNNVITGIFLILSGYIADITSTRFSLIFFTIPVYFTPIIFNKIFEKERVKQAAE